MRTKSIITLLTFFVLSGLLFSSCAGAATPGTKAALADTAALSEVQGAVQIRNPAQADFSAAANGDTLQVQGQLRTGQDGRARLDLSTGTIIRVAPDSLFTLESNRQTDDSLLTRLLMAAGQVWVILNGGQLEIQTPSGTASVRGSFMSVYVDPATNDLWVTCLEGWCQAENPAGVLDLVAGQGATLYSFDPQGNIPPPPPQLRYLTQAEIDAFRANNPEAEKVMQAVMATASALPTLVPSATPTSPATKTPAPTQTRSACLSLLSPANGASLSGPVTFSWTAYPGAAKYVINFKPPSGNIISSIEFGTSHARSMNTLPLAGVYEWWVTVKDGSANDICSSEHFTFTRPPVLVPTFTPTSTPGTGGASLFWNQTGPTGNVGGCNFLFAVETDAPASAMVKVIFSFSPSPNGYTDPHYVLPLKNGSKYAANIELTGMAAGATVYWRFAIYDNGVYTHDDNVYSFVSPGCPPTPPNDTPTSFSNESGPAETATSCVNHFQVDAVDPEGLQYVKVAYKVFDTSSVVVQDTYQHLAYQGGDTWSGDLYIAMQPDFTVVWWFWAIDNAGNSASTSTQSFIYTGGDVCP